MRDYIILTDSCCDLTAEMAAELGIEVLSLSFLMDDKEYFNYLDNRDIQPGDFYNKLREGKLGTTSAISVGVFHDFMAKVVAEGKDILYIAFSSALSTTYQSGCIAAEDVMEENPGSKILVVDSKAASMGQGMLVYLAVQEQRKGRSLEEVRDFVLERRDHQAHWFTVGDLFHLKRGGRVSAATALVGTMLQVKPVLHVDDEGRLINVSKARGRKASIQALLKEMEETVEDPSVVFISHGDCYDEVAELGKAIREKFHVERLEINYVGPVIGNHAGPGVIALFFQAKNK